MLEYTRIEHSMEIRAAGDNILYGTAQDISLVLVRGTDGILRNVKLSIVLVPELKSLFFSSSAAAQKSVKIVPHSRRNIVEMYLCVLYYTTPICTFRSLYRTSPLLNV